MNERAKSWWPWVLMVVGVVLVALLVQEGPSTGRFDPRSARPDGAKAAVELMKAYDASVEVVRSVAVPDGVDRVFVMVDDLSDAQRASIADWVRSGGTAVVADARSPLLDRTSFAFIGDTIAPGSCTITALRGLGPIATRVGTEQFRVEGDRYCYGDERDAFVVAVAGGEGTVVGVGGPEVFLNEFLGDADNAAFAATLLVPRDGMRIAWIRREAGGSGDQSLLDIVPGGVKALLIELIAAFAVFAWARSRRHGRVVREPQAVQIPGSEMVVAVGNLLERTHRRDEAADAVRHDLRRLVRERYGVTEDAPVEAVATVLAARAGVDPQAVVQALGPATLADDDDLVRTARRIEQLREDIS